MSPLFYRLLHSRESAVKTRQSVSQEAGCEARLQPLPALGLACLRRSCGIALREQVGIVFHALNYCQVIKDKMI